MTPPRKNPDGTTPLPNHDWSWRKLAWPVYAKRLARSEKPILVGPWRGEIGFEALYWIPFIDQFMTDYGIAPERIIPITRGGAAEWYGMPKGIELYAMRTPQQVRVQNRVDVAQTGVFKQMAWTPFDREVCHDAAESIAEKAYHVLHPAWMYHTLAAFWTGQRGIEWLAPRLRFRTIPSPPLPDSLKLPENFVAVRFYSRQTFPNHKMTHGFVIGAIQQITTEYDVVILDHDLYLDDHADMTNALRGPRVHHLPSLLPMTPETNLAVQSAVLARSLGFVGTYGGFAQLALRMGKPSVSFYLDWGTATSHAHKGLADLLSLKMGIPSITLRLSELPMLQTILPEVQVQQHAGPSPMALQTA